MLHLSKPFVIRSSHHKALFMIFPFFTIFSASIGFTENGSISLPLSTSDPLFPWEFENGQITFNVPSQCSEHGSLESRLRESQYKEFSVTLKSKIDQTVDPCKNFYGFACGGWRKSATIPPDKSSVGTLPLVQDQNLEKQRAIFEGYASGKNEPPSPYAKKIGDFYTSCMDEARIEQVSKTEVPKLLEKAKYDGTPAGLSKKLAELHQVGIFALFGMSPQSDFKDANRVVSTLLSGGQGLPDRDFYLGEKPNLIRIRKAYVAYLVRLFEISGISPDEARTKAAEVLAFETELATASLDKVSRRDPEKTYHPKAFGQFASEHPAMDWKKYFESMKVDPNHGLNVADPLFFTQLNKILSTTPQTKIETHGRS